MDDLFSDADIISKYTRQQALEDGDLVDVSKTAKEAGFTFPAAITGALFYRLNPTQTEKEKLGQDYEGRLWDVLWVAYLRARANPQENRIKFDVVIQRFTHRPVSRMETIVMVCDGGDNGEPVLTLGLPDDF